MIKILPFSLLLFVFTSSLYSVGLKSKNPGVYKTEKVNYRETLEKERDILDKILHEIYLATAIIDAKSGEPTIVLSETVKTAEYEPLTNKIIVGTEFIEFAVSHQLLKKESIYRFVIGHEFGHYVQTVIDKIGFTKKSKPCDHTIKSETNADFYAVFTNMLNGDTEIEQDTKMIISSVYAHFKPDTFCYPPLDIRLNSAETAITQAKYLHHLFKIANYLTAAEEYKAALNIYNHLSSYYGGAEFYNNKGILYLLFGISGNNKSKRLYFPFELELATKLSIFEKAETLSKTEDDKELKHYSDRDSFIKAIECFDKANMVGGRKNKYILNKVSALILLQNFSSAKILLSNEPIDDKKMKKLLTALCISPLINQTGITDKNCNFGYEETYMEQGREAQSVIGSEKRGRTNYHTQIWYLSGDVLFLEKEIDSGGRSGSVRPSHTA